MTCSGEQAEFENVLQQDSTERLSTSQSNTNDLFYRSPNTFVGKAGNILILSNGLPGNNILSVHLFLS